MTESTLTVTRTGPVFLDSPDAPRKSPFLSGYGPLLALILSCGLFAAGLLISYKLGELRREELIFSLGQRAAVAVENRTNAVTTWLNSQVGLLAPIHEGEVFRLFAAETANRGTDSASASASATEQLRYLQSTFDDILRRAGARSGHLLGPDGTAWLASADAPALSQGQRTAALNALETGTSRLVPARINADGTLTSDLLLPLRPLQALDSGAANRAVAILVVSLPVQPLFARLGTPDRLSHPWEVVRLFQIADNRIQEIDTTAPSPLATIETALDPSTLSYGLRGAVGGTNGSDLVISLGTKIPETPWAVVHESTAAAALAPASNLRTVSVIISFLFSAMVGIILLAFSWRSANSTNQVIADQFRAFAARQSAQKRFQDSVSNAVQELLFATDTKGRLIYVNKAFCEAVAIRPEAANGLPLEAVLEDHGTVAALHRHDEEARAGIGIPAYTIEAQIGDGAPRILTISKTALLNEHGEPAGVVAVARDVTAEREQARRHAKAIKSTVRALSRTVEAADPHLADHAHKLGDMTVLVGRRLDLPEDDIAALEMAANLSQIGKLFVPRDLLTKTERLTQDERQQVEKHVLHALELLSEVDFDLPVLKALSQMNELLDGSGYPFGLSGEAIGHLGRILSVCDVFVARTSKRAYRGSTTAENVLDILEKHPDRYDAAVVATVKTIIAEQAPVH